LTP
jgi:hypothetical protein